MTRLLTHLRSNAIAYLALFVALGGTSYAAISLPAGSVGARQLKRGAVTEQKLASRSVNAAKLDTKSIAGYVAFWAQIDGRGRVLDSRPRATVISGGPTGGLRQINWNRVISPRCFAIANTTILIPDLPPGAPAYANATVVAGRRGSARTDYVDVQTFNASGQLIAEPVSVAVICP